MVQETYTRWGADNVITSKVLLPIAIEIATGEYIANNLLPDRPVPGFAFYYRKYGVAPSVFTEVGEGSEPIMATSTWSEVNDACKEYRIGDVISVRAQKFLDRDIVKDIVWQLTENIMTTQESAVLTLLTGATVTNASTAGTVWSTAATADPCATILNGVDKIAGTEHVYPDTCVLGHTNYVEFLLTVSIRDILKYTNPPIGPGPMVVPEIYGINILRSDAYNGATALLDGTGILMKKGNYTGWNAVAEPLDVITVNDDWIRGVKTAIYKTFKPVLTRANAACKLATL